LASVARAVNWPAIVAEQQYVLASLEQWDVNPAKSAQTYRQAAALAESIHHDYLAANIWNAMSGMATLDESAPTRGLEYASYASAASARIGKPPELETLILYHRAAANMQLGNLDQAESELSNALAIAQSHYPDFVLTLIQGTGFLHETRGENDLAVRDYRKSLAMIEDRGQQESLAAIINRTRLADNLSKLQQYDEALGESRAVTQLADKMLSKNSADRLRAHATFAGVLGVMGSNEQALAELEVALDLARLQGGERSDNFGKLLGVKAGVLLAQGNAVEAAALATRACEIQTFKNGDDSLDAAMCWADSAMTLNQIGDYKTALSRIETALPAVASAFKPEQAEVFTVLVSKGTALAGLGRYSEAVSAFETGIDAMSKSTYPSGFIADAEYGLALALNNSDKARSIALVTSAIARWETDSDGWEVELKTAKQWLRRR
jgi:tetratricopeptide (TPR) repeat protein